jgi:hypothetical protein
MRSADDVRDSVGNGHFSHLNRRFESVRAVVEAREKMAVNINHVLLAKILESIVTNNQ